MLKGQPADRDFGDCDGNFEGYVSYTVHLGVYTSVFPVFVCLKE